MKKTHIIIILVVALVLILGAVLAFGTGKRAEAPIQEALNNQENEGVICTMDAKLCPDGSYVGRTGPNCEFSPCPSAEANAEVPEVKEFVVKGKNFSFEPSLITVQKGDKVRIVFENTAGFHDFVIDEYGAATKQTQAPSTEVLEFTADKAGSFEYYCSVGTHKAMGMKGTLKVE